MTTQTESAARATASESAIGAAPAMPVWGRLAALVAGALLLASVAVGLWFGLSDRVSVFFYGFEAAIAVSAVFCVLLGTGRFAQGASMTLLCVAGSVVVCAGLGMYVASQEGSTFNWRGFALARGGLAGLLVALAGLLVLRVKPWEQVPRFVVAVVLAAPVVAAGGLLLTGRLGVWLGGLPTFAQTVAALFGGMIAVGLLAASTHLAVSAFARGLEGR
jgi:hypothetical protein